MSPIIRIESGALRIDSGSLGVGESFSLPQQANIQHHFDTTDISTLWQDAAGTMAVTSNGDPVKRIDNLGNSLEILTEEDAGQFPVWNAAEGAVDFLGPGKTLNNLNINDGIPDNPISMAVLGYEIEDWQDAIILVWEREFFNRLSVRNDQDGATSDVWEIHLVSGTALSFTTKPTALNTPYSILGWGNADPGQKAWSSTEAAPITGSAVHTPLLDDEFIILSGNNTAGALGINGRIRELVIWEGYQLTDADVEQIKAYDTNKHGTVWT